jgi:hypothetical protein
MNEQDPESPSKLTADSVRRARTALAAAKRTLHVPYPLAGADAARVYDDAVAMAQVILPLARHVTKLLTPAEGQDADAQAIAGSVALRMVSDFDPEAQEEIKGLLVEDLGLSDIVRHMEEGLKKIFHGDLPRAVGIAPDDEEDDPIEMDNGDELTEEEERVDIDLISRLARESLAEIGVTVDEEQSRTFTMSLWDKMKVARGLEHPDVSPVVVNGVSISEVTFEIVANEKRIVSSFFRQAKIEELLGDKDANIGDYLRELAEASINAPAAPVGQS